MNGDDTTRCTSEHHLSDQTAHVRSFARPAFGSSAYYLVAFVLAVLGVVAFQFDQPLAEPDNLAQLPGDLKRIVTLSEIFAHGYGIAIVSFCIFLLHPAARYCIPRIAFCAIWPSLGVHLVKLLVGRRRPICFYDEDSQTHFPENIFDSFVGWLPNDKLNTVYEFQSFPSGHTGTVWGLAIGLAWAYPKGRWLFFSIAFFGSIQRVTSFAHWPSDVCFGAAIGFMMAGAMTQNWGLGYLFTQFEERLRAKP